MKNLIYVIFMIISITANSSPFIEGGKSIPLTDTKYIDSIKLQKDQGAECSATRVAHNKILTASHCLQDDNLNKIYNVGDMLGFDGRIVSISMHPEYNVFLKRMKAVKLKYDNEPDKTKRNSLINEYRNLEKRKSSHDIAIITTNKKKSNRSIPYPRVVSSKTEFSTRSNLEIIGYGSKKISWSSADKNWIFANSSTSAQLAKTSWATCPNSYEKKEVDNLTEDILGILQIKNKTIHKITDGYETQAHDGPMILSGDSGAGVIEYDKDNSMVITAVAASIKPYDEGSGSPVFFLEYADGSKKTINLNKMPKNWGDPNKSSLDFSEIKNQIIKDGMDIEDKAIKITRSFKRASTGIFADLLHPLNQSFLNKALNP